MFTDRISSLKSKVSPLEKQYLDLQQRQVVSQTLIEKFQKELEKSKDTLMFQTECVEWLKQIVKSRGDEHLKKIVNLCSLALQTVFPDRTYEFQIKVEDKRGSNTAEFVLWEMLSSGESIETPFDSLGGSIRTVIGLVLQIYFISYFNYFPVLFCDESLGSLAEESIPYLMTFLKEIASQQGFIFVLVSHDSRIFDYCDKVYEVGNHTAVLVA